MGGQLVRTANGSAETRQFELLVKKGNATLDGVYPRLRKGALCGVWVKHFLKHVSLCKELDTFISLYEKCHVNQTPQHARD